MFEVVPCVDVRRGRAVRLLAGDPDAETVYFADPLAAASHWVERGAACLHVVDLDATLEDGLNLTSIERLCEGLDVPVQVAGGVRSVAAAERRLAFAARVVLGTVAVLEPQVVVAAVERFGPDRVVVSVDAVDGKVVVRGWRAGTEVDATALARRMHEVGVRRLVFTDVTRDGSLRSIDPAPVTAVREAFPGTLHAGGGVATDDDLALYESIGLDGAIVGRALYEGTVTYPRAT